MSNIQCYTLFETRNGVCAISWGEDGISGFRLPGERAQETLHAIRRRLPAGVEAVAPPEIGQVIDRVLRYFSGEAPDFSDLRLDLSAQTEGFRQIYAATRRVGWGKTTTYGTLARDLGLGPVGAREIGQAMAKNPIPLIIPCHRVLAAGGKLGGFSAPGGTLSKQRMLELEGFAPADASPIQQSFGF